MIDNHEKQKQNNIKAIKEHIKDLCDFEITNEEIEANFIELMRLYKLWKKCNIDSNLSNECANGGYHLILSKDELGNIYTRSFKCPKLANNIEFIINNNIYYKTPDIVNEFQRLKKEEIWIDKTKYNKRTNFINTLLNIKKDYINNVTKGIYVQGESNSGKSYILMAFCNEMALQGKTVVFVTANSLDLEIKKSIGEGSSFSNEIVELMIACDVLIIDELGNEQFKPNTHSSILYNVLNYRNTFKDKITIMSSKYSLKELNKVYSNNGKNENVTQFVNRIEKLVDKNIFNISPSKTN